MCPEHVDVWHGSPYDYDRVEDKAIGSGEGTPTADGKGYGAYSHGHYYTDTKGIGVNYLKALTDRLSNSSRTFKLDGIPREVLHPWLVDAFSVGSKKIALHKMEEKYLQEVEEDKKAGRKPNGDKEAQIEEDKEWAVKEEKRLHEDAEKLNIPKDLRNLDTHDLQLLFDAEYAMTELGLHPTVAADDAIGNMRRKLKQHKELGGIDGFFNFHGELSDRELDKRRDRLHSILHPSRVEIEENKHPGRLYRARLNLDPDKLLQWDEKMSEHHPDTQHAIGKAYIPPPDPQFMEDEDEHFERVKNGNWFQGLRGEDIYQSLAMRHGGPAASKLLMSHGVNGVRYQDGASRHKKLGSELFLDDTKVPAWDGTNPDHLARVQKPPLPMDDNLHGFTPDNGESSIDENNDFYIASNIAFGLKALNHDFKNIDGLIKHHREGADRAKHLRNRMIDRKPEDIAKDEEPFGTAAADWLEKNRHRVKIEKKQPRYNYVVFDPNLIQLLQKFDKEGKLVKDYSAGVTLKPVDHDPFAE